MTTVAAFRDFAHDPVEPDPAGLLPDAGPVDSGVRGLRTAGFRAVSACGARAASGQPAARRRRDLSAVLAWTVFRTLRQPWQWRRAPAGLAAYAALHAGADLLARATGLSPCGLENRAPAWKLVLGLNPETRGGYSEEDWERIGPTLDGELQRAETTHAVQNAMIEERPGCGSCSACCGTSCATCGRLTACGGRWGICRNTGRRCMRSCSTTTGGCFLRRWLWRAGASAEAPRRVGISAVFYIFRSVLRVPADRSAAALCLFAAAVPIHGGGAVRGEHRGMLAAGVWRARLPRAAEGRVGNGTRERFHIGRNVPFHGF